VIKARVFIATMTAVVACVVILWATFFNPKLLGLATAMVPLLTALCTGLLDDGVPRAPRAGAPG
jgi:hypothetical protein